MLRFLKLIVAFFCGLLTLAGCTKAELYNSFIPRDGYTVHRNIAYGPESRQVLDIYTPDAGKSNGRVLMFFYGGSWQSGEKELYRFIGQAFTSRGYTVVIPDYRLYPEVYFPAFMNDSAAAFVWVHQHISEYGGDPKELFISGHSAGGYNALMLALNEQYLNEAGGSTKWIRGVIGLAGPYDFLPFTDPQIIALFSKSDTAATQPINYVRKNMPRVLLLTGGADDEVDARNSRNLAAKLRAYGNAAEEKIYPDVGHIRLVLSLAYGFRAKAPVLDDIDAFIARVPRQRP